MYKEKLKEYFDDMGVEKFHVSTPDPRKAIDLNNLDSMSEEMAKEIYESLKRIENGEAEEVQLED